MLASSPAKAHAENECEEFIQQLYAQGTDRSNVLGFYEEVAAKYDTIHAATGLGWDGPRILVETVLKSSLGSFSSGKCRVLDFAAGTGQVGEQLVAQAGSLAATDLEVDAVDLSPNMIEVAGKKGVYSGLYSGNLEEDIILPKASYNLILACGVIGTHVGGDFVLQRLAPLLASGGTLAYTIKSTPSSEFCGMARSLSEGGFTLTELAVGPLNMNNPSVHHRIVMWTAPVHWSPSA
eukprot:CAMPEP_0204382544 /NCGR_PEP_ID=MMETSP0469-20131031/55187_1 /ASSEMBLY_ACC=CAM_ASM_000384 /TAXON_ID=2969 /ORGANISM="Oxyrrhis marina" /LENGTH=235 /DNA_ID=CAMNT_0051374635 /DNA_START=52 /DNA_END=759 /DNA_ORIENTATION=+